MPVFSKLLLPPPLLLLLQLLKIYLSLSLILQLPLLHLPSLLIHKPILLFVEPSSAPHTAFVPHRKLARGPRVLYARLRFSGL